MGYFSGEVQGLMNLCRACNRDFITQEGFDSHRVGRHEYTYSEGVAMDEIREDGRRCLEDLELFHGHYDGRRRKFIREPMLFVDNEWGTREQVANRVIQKKRLATARNLRGAHQSVRASGVNPLVLDGTGPEEA